MLCVQAPRLFFSVWKQVDQSSICPCVSVELKERGKRGIWQGNVFVVTDVKLKVGHCI